jgi:hypothetical protein
MSGRSSVLSGPPADEVASGGELAHVKHREALRGGEQRVAAPVRERGDALADTAQVDHVGCEPPDETDDRAIGIEVVPPDAHVREDGQERPRDRVELFPRQLVERQPLAEEARRGETSPHRAEHLARVEAARSGVPRDKEIGDDDVVAIGARGEPAASIVDDEVDVRAAKQRRVPGAEVGVRGGGDLGNELDDRRALDAERGRRARADARRHAHEHDPVRRRVEEKRNESLPALVRRRGTAAEHVVVVEAELQVVPGVDDRDDPARALGGRAQRLARGEMGERRAHRIEEHGEEKRGVPDGAKAGGRDDVGEDDVRGRGEQESAAETEPRSTTKPAPIAPTTAPNPFAAPSSPSGRAAPPGAAEHRPERWQHGARGHGGGTAVVAASTTMRTTYSPSPLSIPT